VGELELARWQFAITTVYHFFFVPLTLGLSILVAIMETQYLRKGDATYRRMAQFWGRLLVINFAMGVVTGIVQEFQFGLNWSDYSRFVGDIFGAPLAVEALLAFFLESTFLGLWIFGWDRLPRGLHAACIWLVAIGSNVSAFWILVANSFMQHPVGYTLNGGRAEMTDFFALITNPYLSTQFPHVFLAGLATGAFFVLGISAYHLGKRSLEADFYRRSLRLAVVAGLIASVLIVPVGHFQGQRLEEMQPMKLASAEALWDTEDPAAMSLFTWGDQANLRDVFAIKLPWALSFMVYGVPQGTVQGIKQLQAQYEQQYGPRDYVPWVFATYWSFRIMVGAGLLMILAALLASLFLWREGIRGRDRLLMGLTASIALPYLANTTGWLLAELGRQPWIVYGLMPTAEGVSPTVSAGMVLFSVVVLTVLYGALMVADVYLLLKFARGGPSLIEAEGETIELRPAKTF